MGRKTAIHIEPVRAGSEKHNQREEGHVPDYVNKDKTGQNEQWMNDTISERKAYIKSFHNSDRKIKFDNEEEKSKWYDSRYRNREKGNDVIIDGCEVFLKKRKLSKKANPIREGVVVTDVHVTMDDLKKLAKVLEEKYGIRCFQIYHHLDEGFYEDNGEFNHNYHAHFLFDWTHSKTGTMLRLTRDDLSKMQDDCAEILKMERGVKGSDNVHLNHHDFRKLKQEEKRISDEREKFKQKKNNFSDEREKFKDSVPKSV